MNEPQVRRGWSGRKGAAYLAVEAERQRASHDALEERLDVVRAAVEADLPLGQVHEDQADHQGVEPDHGVVDARAGIELQFEDALRDIDQIHGDRDGGQDCGGGLDDIHAPVYPLAIARRLEIAVRLIADDLADEGYNEIEFVQDLERGEAYMVGRRKWYKDEKRIGLGRLPW